MIIYRRLSIDERRRTLANEALQLADTVKKSMAGRKSVAYAGDTLPPGAEELASIPGNVLILPFSNVNEKIAELWSLPRATDITFSCGNSQISVITIGRRNEY